LLADDVVLSELAAPADRVGKKEVMKGWKETWKGMSDAKIQHTSIWAAGDYVVATGSFSGTNDGPLPSAKVWTKTGKPVNVQCLEISKIEGGKIKKHWTFSNGLAFAAQLGLLPPEKKAKPTPAAKPVADNKAAAPAMAPAAQKAAAPAPVVQKASTPATPAAPKAGTPAAPAQPAPAAPPAAPVKPVPAPAAPPAAAPAKPAPAPGTPAPGTPAK
jgi:predicted ester cyclase